MKFFDSRIFNVILVFDLAFSRCSTKDVSISKKYLHCSLHLTLCTMQYQLSLLIQNYWNFQCLHSMQYRVSINIYLIFANVTLEYHWHMIWNTRRFMIVSKLNWPVWKLNIKNLQNNSSNHFLSIAKYFKKN